MFTGIIEEIGTVTAVSRSGSSLRLSVRGPLAVSDAHHGDSIAVSGVCLTVVEQSADGFAADVMGQTLAMSTLATVDVGRRVNLERAAHVGDRLGGHIVQGHVDGTSRLESITDDGDWRVLRFSLPAELARLVVDKGSIAVDGTSLTVSDVAPAEHAAQWFEVSLIPETLTATTLGDLSVGDHVNIETDIIARHVERMLALGAAEGSNR
ncbi:riboflavin synthase [Paramicrobacterium fandaimingii]|uniref:riboflavin synthase n=1 Tax=Paramicrobacterium fandaimingii TaxID=2708079 RepID=UPI00141EF438|nr:riboflavin synthase [Microbacterium fandaimingii]